MSLPFALKKKKAPSQQAIDALRDAATALDVEDILDLCYSFAQDPVRLRVYLDALRSKGGIKAQAAACLICFDLARRGDRSFENEFLTLVPVMQEFILPELVPSDESTLVDDDSLDFKDMMEDAPVAKRPIDVLVGDNAFLSGLLRELEKSLELLDPRREPVHVESFSSATGRTEAVELNLFDENELSDLDIELGDLDILEETDSALQEAWQTALDAFIVGPPPNALGIKRTVGFFAKDKVHISELEKLHRAAVSLEAPVERARHLLALTDLFFASHLRAKNLFGKRNRERDRYLEDGLERFAKMETPPDDVVSWLSPPTAGESAWPKVAEILLDYCAHLGSQDSQMLPHGGGDEAALAKSYIVSKRQQPPPAVLDTKKQKGGRRGF
ncbi:MAG: hypothetical protein GY822_17270 [Deltaproteobacteria bacterium]|nr:hypothetical protein [Deltaproteobacteria bacterium]